MTAATLLEVRDLTVEFMTRRGIVQAVQHVNVSVAKGETVGIVGESGSGKSVTSYAVMRILDRAGKIADGSITFSGIDVRDAPESEMRDLRGREMSMIFQSPRTALNPIRKVGDQIDDVLLQHVQAQPSDVKEKAIEALKRVRIARPEERFHAYPFELSGGMCQRVVIALALACQPQLLIADEPTTGLDVTTQKAVMDLVVELTRERGMSTILITHDLGLAAAYCDKVVVMEKGKVVETALSANIFKNPQHPYTRKLMRATPRLGVSLRDLLPEDLAAEPFPAPTPAAEEELADKSPLLVVSNLVKEYARQGATRNIGEFLSQEGPVAGGGDLQGGRRHLVHDQARRERGPGRRIRLRQVHHLDDGDAAARSDLRHGHIRRRGYRRDPGQGIRQVADAQAHPDGVPGPDRVAQPALHRGARDRRPDHAHERHQGRAMRCARVARNWRAMSACRSNCSTVSRINCPAARRRASASRARSRSIPNW